MSNSRSNQIVRQSLLALALPVLLVACTGTSLNPYKGSLNDLLPKQVGQYKLVNTSVPPTPEGGHLRVTFKFSDVLVADYQRSDTNEHIGLLVLNYPSADNAVYGWRRQQEYLTAEGGPRMTTREEPTTKKGSAGKLLVWDGHGFGTPGVAWTNGSVLFLVQDDLSTALAFESIFPY